MDSETRVRRDCMRAQIRRALVKRIIEGHYRPGDRLLELQIAAEFNTSQGPVREALRELEAMRLVESEAYRGTRVRAISEREMHEASQVRGVLEQAAGQLAAAAMKGNTTALRHEFDALLNAAARRDLDEYAARNMAFHRTIVLAAANAVLLRVWDSLMLEVRTRIGLSQLSLDLDAVAESHRPILEALDSGDAEAAGRLLKEHAEQFFHPEPARATAGQERTPRAKPRR